MNSSLLV